MLPGPADHRRLRKVGIPPVICRQERVGYAIADGFSRTTNGNRIGVFASQGRQTACAP